MRKNDFDNLVASIRQAGRIRRGEAAPSRVTKFRAVDVKAIRQRLGQSQTEFARMIGVSVATLQNWEQGRRRPEGPARALLKSGSLGLLGIGAQHTQPACSVNQLSFNTRFAFATIRPVQSPRKSLAPNAAVSRRWKPRWPVRRTKSGW